MPLDPRMKADAAPPTTPAVVPLAAPAVTDPAAVIPPDQHAHPRPAEPNALLNAAQSLWANLKAGHFGSGKVWLVVALVAGVGLLWWYLANQSKKAASEVWTALDAAATPPLNKADQTPDERLKQYADELKKYADGHGGKNSPTSAIAELSALRLRRDAAKGRMFGPTAARKQADRQAAADELEKLREDFVKAADLFPTDRTLKAAALLDAADLELTLVGVPKAGVQSMYNVSTLQLEVQPNSRGQVDRYADLLRKASEAIGKDTDAGKGFLASADKLSGEDEKKKVYAQLGELHVKFNNADFAAPKPADKVPPAGGGDEQPGGERPKPPDVVPPNPPAPTPGPPDAPKPPADLPPNK